MKVIHFIASIDQNGGGTTEYMRLLSTALKESCTLSIATGISDHPIAIDGVPVRFFDNRVLRWYSLLKEFQNYLKEEKPDLVHINGIWSPQNWGFQKVAQQLNIKVILSPHGMLEPWIINHNPWKKKLAMAVYQNNAIQKANYLHATAVMEEKSIKALGYTNAISIIPNGIDLNEIISVKSSYGSKKMVFLSRIHPKKGIELLLEAWRTGAHKDWTLEIAGNGDTDYIKSLIDSSSDLDSVQFVGAKYGEDKWDFLRSADVLVLPTHSENFGIVVAEAMAVGVPVLTTTGTPWDDLDTYECGWWIDLSVLQLQKTLEIIFNTPNSTLERMGKNARNLVKEKYDIKQIAKSINQLYNTI